MTGVKTVNRFFLLFSAPFLGMIIWLLFMNVHIRLEDYTIPAGEPILFHEKAQPVHQKLVKAATDGSAIKATIEKYYQMYEKSANDMNAILKQATNQVSKPAVIFDNRIAEKLGKPIRQTSSGNIDLKLYSFNESSYKGFALKADLKSDKAMKMTMGRDKLGGSETTLSAASRYGAVAGINAGGFADDSKGRFPTGTTILNGKYVYGFFPSENNLSFVGMSTDRKLIGGAFSRQQDLDARKPSFGASFVPVLLQNGKKTAIPSQWLTSPSRAARTVIGSLKNDQVLILVTDGVDERGNSGATLPELQDKLLQLGVKDAYNLDGGGSSTLVYDGQVINRPSDGQMRSLPTHFLFFR